MATYNKYQAGTEALNESVNAATDTWRVILSNTAPKLEAIETLLARFNVQFDAIQAQKNNDIEALIAIQSMLYELQQDEEDIELLLLA